MHKKLEFLYFTEGLIRGDIAEMVEKRLFLFTQKIAVQSALGEIRRWRNEKSGVFQKNHILYIEIALS